MAKRAKVTGREFMEFVEMLLDIGFFDYCMGYPADFVSDYMWRYATQGDKANFDYEDLASIYAYYVECKGKGMGTLNEVECEIREIIADAFDMQLYKCISDRVNVNLDIGEIEVDILSQPSKCYDDIHVGAERLDFFFNLLIGALGEFDNTTGVYVASELAEKFIKGELTNYTRAEIKTFIETGDFTAPPVMMLQAGDREPVAFYDMDSYKDFLEQSNISNISVTVTKYGQEQTQIARVIGQMTLQGWKIQLEE